MRSYLQRVHLVPHVTPTSSMRSSLKILPVSNSAQPTKLTTLSSILTNLIQATTPRSIAQLVVKPMANANLLGTLRAPTLKTHLPDATSPKAAPLLKISHFVQA